MNALRVMPHAQFGMHTPTSSNVCAQFDEAIALPSEMSARISRNTQLILQNETGIPKVCVCMCTCGCTRQVISYYHSGLLMCCATLISQTHMQLMLQYACTYVCVCVCARAHARVCLRVYVCICVDIHHTDSCMWRVLVLASIAKRCYSSAAIIAEACPTRLHFRGAQV
jgi:hypothetical protein